MPGSDGAGVVEATGSRVTRFKTGDKVVPLFNQGHLAGALDSATASTTGTGGTRDGTLRQYGAFDEQALVSMPETLDFKQASTLTCAALTAWNALYGLESKGLKPGDTVLTQGTGGVSIFALQVGEPESPFKHRTNKDTDKITQFAKTAGASVIATTSSDSKAQTLKKLGADHVLNYKSDPEWGAKAKELSRRG